MVSPRVDRVTSRTPNCSSSCAMDLDTAGWPTLRSRAAAENDFASPPRTNVSTRPRRSLLVTTICRYGLGGITSDQRRQFLETAMDVDLDESCRLARR